MGEDRRGYVYVLRACKPHDECYKIGRTKDPRRRLYDFGVRLPFKVDVVCCRRVDDMVQAEKNLHTAFAWRRFDGEWFRLDPDDVEWIKNILLTIQATNLCDRLSSLHATSDDFEEKWGTVQYLLSVRARAVARMLRRFRMAKPETVLRKRDAELATKEKGSDEKKVLG